jgi:ankyrin repeat protein
MVLLGGQSPLFVASEEGHCDGLKCLLSFGADINLCDEGLQHQSK